ncbi:MAG: hypothetical protein ABI624_13835 [Casimicrobiaceae bacterium]
MEQGDKSLECLTCDVRVGSAAAKPLEVVMIAARGANRDLASRERDEDLVRFTAAAKQVGSLARQATDSTPLVPDLGMNGEEFGHQLLELQREHRLDSPV